METALSCFAFRQAGKLLRHCHQAFDYKGEPNPHFAGLGSVVLKTRAPGDDNQQISVIWAIFRVLCLRASGSSIRSWSIESPQSGTAASLRSILVCGPPSSARSSRGWSWGWRQPRKPERRSRCFRTGSRSRSGKGPEKIGRSRTPARAATVGGRGGAAEGQRPAPTRPGSIKARPRTSLTSLEGKHSSPITQKG